MPLISSAINNSLLPAVFIEGETWLEDLNWIFSKASKYRCVVEIGSFRGKTAFAWLAGGVSKLISIDTCNGRWEPHVGREMLTINLKNFGIRWSLIQEELSESAEILAELLAGMNVDAVFINSMISKDKLLESLKFAASIVQPCGIICGDGYSFSEAEDKSYGNVVKIINKFFPHHSRAGKTLWHADCPSLTSL